MQRNSKPRAIAIAKQADDNRKMIALIAVTSISTLIALLVLAA